MHEASTPQEIIVLGAGVSGLTTAIVAQDAGYAVTIVAEHFPGDPPSIEFCSPWAGAHHLMIGGSDPLQIEMETLTFWKMWEMSESKTDAGKDCFLRLKQIVQSSDAGTEDPLRLLPEFRSIPPDDLLPGMVSGASFTTLSIDAPKYLLYLFDRFKSKGGRTIRSRVQHVSQVYEGAFSPPTSRPDAVIVCVGLGARTLGGIEDKEMYPVRGQTVIIQAPWVKESHTIYGPNGACTYTIPRPNGEVVLGGCKDPDDWYPRPRPGTKTSIIDRCLLLCPTLADSTPNKRPSKYMDVEALVTNEGCGFRPSRKGGVRLGGTVVTSDGKDVAVFYNYGHGGFGFQASWGYAQRAVGLLNELRPLLRVDQV